MNKLPIILLFLASLLCFYHCGISQSYHAINGSPYAGSTGFYNNPATTVNCAYQWDLTLLSFQTTISNSAFTIDNGTISSYDSATAQFTNGLRSRYFHANLDINLLNFRFKIGKKSAFAFALRGRTYNHLKTLPFDYNDSITSLPSFLNTNKVVNYIQGYATHSGWMEADFNFSHIFIQNANSRLSGGITLGYMKALSGAHISATRISYAESNNNNLTNYILTGGAATVEYSQNYDSLDAAKDPMVNAKAFLKNTLHAFNLSMGAEYLIRDQSTQNDIPLTATNYDWKIGISIMDLGTNKYKPVGSAFNASMPKQNITAAILQQQLSNATSLSRIRDSLAQSFNSVDSLTSVFSIANPTKLIINVDKNLGNHFYMNGELNINFFSTQPQQKLKTREINLLTITPRWETSSLGFYLPMQYNTQGQIWVGAAIKLGPLLLGFHSLDFVKWFKVGSQTYNGGGYLVLNIHPFAKKEKEQECPSF